MIKSRIKPILLSAAAAAVLIATGAHAQAPDDGRDASFLPPPAFEEPAIGGSAASPAPAPVPSTVPTPVTVRPVTLPAEPTSTPQTQNDAPPLVTPPPAASYVPPINSPTSVVTAPVPASTAIPPPPPPAALAAVPPAAPPVSAPVDLGKPVQAAKLGDINPQSIGLFSASEGGLGDAIWKDTPRSLVEEIFPTLSLPASSLTLNSLAQRLFLTTTAVPAGPSAGGLSLTSLRVNALVALGNAKDAWKLIEISPSEEIDDDTYKHTAEMLLASSQAAEICAKLPDISKNRSKTDWQQLMLVCQLQAKDVKAAQLTLDLMHSQDIKDDTFFFLAERNVIAGARELPRQLTPLKPLNLALLQLTDLPVRSEVYAHPDTSLIAPVLAMKTKDDNIRLSLAERAAERGLITSVDLEAIYMSIAFPPEAIAGAAGSGESIVPRLHALLYQSSQQEKDAEKRIALAIKFLQNATGPELNGVQAHVMGDIIGAVTPMEGYNSVSAQVAHIYMLIGNPQAALAWVKQARHAAIGMPGVATDLQNLWPLLVLSGLETDTDYAANLGKWLDAAIAVPNAKDSTQAQREKAGSVLLLLDAAGYAVPDEQWTRVMATTAPERHTVPPAMLMDRLRASSVANQRGETVLISLLLSGGNIEEPSFLATLGIIRALRLVGLMADSAALARETATLILTPPPGKS